MSVELVEDLATLASTLERADRALGRGRRALRSLDPATLAGEVACPLDAFRPVTQKRTYDALLARSTSRADEPLRASCARWVAELLRARVGWDLEVDEARAERGEPASHPHAHTSPTSPPPEEASLREALLGLLESDASPVSRTHVTRLARLGPRLGAARDARRERLDEATRRLGRASRFDHALVRRDELAAPPPEAEGTASPGLVLAPSSDLIAALAREMTPTTPKAAPDDVLPEVPCDALVGSAARFLRATEPLAVSLLRRAHRAREARDGLDPWDTFRLAAAREVRGADWPARLGADWVAARFSAMAGAAHGRVSAEPPKRVVGAASFLGAAVAYGEALARHESLRYAPFPVAVDPQPVAARRTGLVCALAMASAPFLARELGASRAASVDAARSLGVAVLFAARAEATCLLVTHEGVSDAVRELDARAGGAFAAVGFAVPRPRDDAPSRWLALLTAPAMHDALVHAHDDDYYRNPRTNRWLVARLSRPALESTWLDGPPPQPDALALALVSRFEEALG